MKRYKKLVGLYIVFAIILVGINIFTILHYYEEKIELYEHKLDKLYTLQTNKPSYDYLKSVTVPIFSTSVPLKDGEHSSSLGTGTIIKIKDEYTYILTNKHVINYDKLLTPSDYSIVNVVRVNGKKYEAELVKAHSKYDIAVIRIKAILKDKQVIKGIDYSISPSDPIYMVGHHLGRLYIYGEGVFAGWDNNYGIIQIPTCPGNSGTGVFNKEGKLIGVVFAVNYVNFFSFDIAHGLIINTDKIADFLQNILLD